MATTEKSIELDGDDCAVSRKAALLHVRLTRLLGVTVMLLVLLMVFYLVYLHVRLVKLEQLQCVAEATRTSVVTTTNEDDDDDDDDADDDDITDKVRISLSDSSNRTVRRRRPLAGFLQLTKLSLDPFNAWFTPLRNYSRTRRTALADLWIYTTRF